MDTSDLWYAYLLRCEANRLYTGISRDVIARFKQHLSGHGALFTRLFHPNEFIGAIPVGSRTHAQRFEKQVKTWKTQRKLRLFEQFGLIDLHRDNIKKICVNPIVSVQTNMIIIDCRLIALISTYANIPLSNAYEALRIDPTSFEKLTISSLRLAELIQVAFRLDTFYSRSRNFLRKCDFS
ncbi:GIY-YIG nuclease family protein [Solilutibacter silvestris]|uniref:GIY-YIG nuclease family protein n=1 Tax=Solilutibacter silvestris TaxID=1645665 RepID=UPI003D34142D